MTEPTNDHQPDRIADVVALIEKIVRKSLDGNYIFRGEPEHYDDYKFKRRVTSNLCRDHIAPVKDETTGEFDETKYTYPSQDVLKRRQAWTIQICKDHVADIDGDNFEILTALQHYGLKTNLIDFTTDCHIALFFACNGSHEKDGRVVLLNRSGDLDKSIKSPKHPQSRVLAQKSVLVEPPDGYIEPAVLRIINVPSNLKQWALIYLKIAHNISTTSIYNDMQGFVERMKQNENESKKYIMQLYLAEEIAIEMVGEKNIESAINTHKKYIEHNPFDPNAYEKIAMCYHEKGEFDQAIEYFTKSILLNPGNPKSYILRGASYLGIDMRDVAVKDFITAWHLIPDQDLSMKYPQYIKNQYGVDLPEETSEE